MRSNADQVLLRPREAAAMLALSRSTVQAMLADGTLPRYQIGGSVRTSRAAVEAFIARSRVAPTRRERAAQATPPATEQPGCLRLAEAMLAARRPERAR